MNLTCKTCGEIGSHKMFHPREMMYGLRHTFPYMECTHCGCLQIVDFPSDMSPYYPSDYYSLQAPNLSKFSGFKWNMRRGRYRATVLRQSLTQKMLHAVLPGSRYNAYFPHVKDLDCRILDVGCGNGISILYPLADMGFANLLGVDPYLKEDITYPNGLPVRRQAIGEVEGEWDFITYHHSFEHVPDPMVHMENIHRLLAPDGVCLIRIPTASSYVWRHYGIDWAQLDAPRHFFLHTRESMAHLAGKAGLDLFEVRYDSTHFQFSGSEKLRRDRSLQDPLPKGPLNWARRKIRKKRYTAAAKRLNKAMDGDQACFFLRRK